METSNKSHAHRGTLPQKDTDLADVALHVAKTWADDPSLTLRFTDSKAFFSLVTDYRALLDTKNGQVSERRGVTLRIAEAEKEITKGVRQVKLFLAQKYDTGALDHFGRFGLVHQGKNFRLPSDQSKKRDALLVMKNAVVSEGWGDSRYGADFWQSTLDRFDALLTEARTIDGTISGLVADKNSKRDAIRKTLNAIVLSLKAAYPDGHEGALRKWGIQRDKF
ncbi:MULTISPECIES: hypothetical protein [unclassified Flavobacterium]|uniref:hypothetical protein n=1 Tax=unclassified Flavobacterium TaxID=196869 RepID=UPI001F1449FE|nr:MULTISPECIES: hypothetical protein [unclassified Flavobacterium]UMY64355.1 hypothetical protein MKO97_07490 [Flavobacterium sp. HJ-32-4]